MSDVSGLKGRLDAEMEAARARAQQSREGMLRENEQRQQRLARFTEVVGRLRDVWGPRLELLRDRFTGYVEAQPEVKPYARRITFSFASRGSSVKLTFSAVPDQQVRNLVLDYELEILPILMKFERNDRLEMPLDNVDEGAVARWLDDRIISFVQTYVKLQGDDFFRTNLLASEGASM
jgi:hypothetical protein